MTIGYAGWLANRAELALQRLELSAAERTYIGKRLPELWELDHELALRYDLGANAEAADLEPHIETKKQQAAAELRDTGTDPERQEMLRVLKLHSNLELFRGLKTHNRSLHRGSEFFIERAAQTKLLDHLDVAERSIEAARRAGKSFREDY